MSEESKSPIININAIPASVDNAVKNLTDKPSLNVGTTISDLWFLVFGGISQAADKRKLQYAHELATFKAELEESIDKIPEEKRVEPSIQITAQALENSKYCVESKDLRDMFTSLISNSMNIDYQKYVHPSFAEMIKQMSPIDAQLLKVFKNGPVNGFPLCDYRLRRENGYITVVEKVFLDGPIDDFGICANSISSLEHFGLVTVPQGTYIVNADLYKKFEEYPLYSFLKDFYKNDGELYIEKCKVALTPLGQSFVSLCIPN